MSEARFSLIFRGSSVDGGEIDVQDFAPALLSVGDLMQAANDRINGARAKAVVRVSATAASCFQVDLILDAKAAIDASGPILDALAERKEGIAVASELADLVLKVGAGIVAGSTAVGGGLLALVKWLKGRKPDQIEDKAGDVHIHLGDKVFITNRKTIQLAEDAAVREHAKRLVSVLNHDGMDSLTARREGDKDLSIERHDVASFEIPESVEEVLLDETRKLNLQIISLSFKEDNKWRLTDGAEPFSATIEDIEFIKKIASDDITFAKNDYLICEVRERQVRTNKGLKKERTIMRIIEHKRSPRQLKLI